MGNRLVFRKSKAALNDQALAEMGRKAIEDRDALLEKCPHLREFQKNIDRLLNNAGSFENRMAVLGVMMEANLRELQKHLTELGFITNKWSTARPE